MKIYYLLFKVVLGRGALIGAFMSRKPSLKALWTDTDGFIVPMVTVLLVIIIGTSVLALDGARYVSLQSQLQHGADEIALAGAAELDGTTGAIARANAAMATVTPAPASFPASTLFGTGSDQFVRIQSVRFLSRLPASDRTFPIPAGFDTANDLLAHFVEVTVTPVMIPTILPAAFFGGSTFPTVATAVAGFSKNVCKFTPMYVCNPYETAGMTYEAATQALKDHDTSDPDDLNHRQMYSMRYDPGGSFNPGNYGFLVPPDGPGVANIREGIARVAPETCFSQMGVDTETGFTGVSLASAWNTRFDVYSGPLSGRRNDADYAPALNVRKGWIANTCPQSASGPPQAMALPPDQGSGAIPNIGDGSWNFDGLGGYWSTEHPTAPLSAKPVPTAGNPLPSRYSVYKYEIAQGSNAGGLSDLSPGREQGRPVCSSQVPPANVDRRIFFSAVLNCQSLTASGILHGGRSRNVPVAAFARFFLIHPAIGPADQIDAEFVGLVKDSDTPPPPPNTVQLYR